MPKSDLYLFIANLTFEAIGLYPAKINDFNLSENLSAFILGF
jgi:hypothetical protein